MTQIPCPETPEECGSIGSRGMWSHLHNTHGWDKDEARQWLSRQKSGGNDDEPDSGAANTPSDDAPENSPETPERKANQGENGFRFDEKTAPPQEKPDRDPSEGEDAVPEADEDAIVVEEEGSEKLSPEGFDSRNRPEMSAPEGADLPDDVTPDDFEPEESDEGNSHDETHSSQSETVSSEVSDSQNTEEDDGESGGVLSKLRKRGSDDDEEPQSRAEEIVEEADDPDEQERRQRVLDSLNGENNETENRDETPEGEANQTDSDTQSQPDPSPKPAQMQNGMVVDEKLLETLFGLPFDQAANLTGWDGWQLSPEEKEANARLFRAWADERDIDLGPGVMFAMSLSSTVGTRAVGYQQHRKQQKTENDPEPERERQPAEPDTSGPNSSEQTSQTQQTADAQTDDQTFDPDQPIGQRTPGEA